MRKSIFLLGVAALILISLAALAACQILPSHGEAPLTPTITPVHIVVSVSLTPTAAKTPTAAPTSTPEPTQLSISIPTLTASESSMPFHLQAGTQRFIPAFTRVEQGCAWSGVAGQVFDSTGSGLAGVIVVVTGRVDGETVDQSGVTEVQSAYGPGGYEITLADHLPASDEGLFIQLFASSGAALTAAEPFHMPDHCDHNLVLMNFQALYTLRKSYLPMIGTVD